MDEYQQVQNLREMWSRFIMTWGQVLIPLGAAIVAFFVSQTAPGGFDSEDCGILLIGWALFAICMVYWRWVVHHLDEQIVRLYPVMLRLDRTNNWDTQTRHYYHSLAKRSKRHLRHALGVESLPGEYDDFVDEARHKGLDRYGILLDVWREFDQNSVGDRGHKIQDILVFTVIVLFLILVLWIQWAAWSLLALFLFVLLGFWVKHRGWWFV